jgi:hypothetical protein
MICLQAALVEVAQLLQESRRAEEGLRAENAKVLDLSAVSGWGGGWPVMA